MDQPLGYSILDVVTGKALSSEPYKQDLINNPVAKLRAEGLEIPDGINVVIMENTEDTIYLVLPTKIGASIGLDEVDITVICNEGGHGT